MKKKHAIIERKQIIIQAHLVYVEAKLLLKPNTKQYGPLFPVLILDVRLELEAADDILCEDIRCLDAQSYLGSQEEGALGIVILQLHKKA